MAVPAENKTLKAASSYLKKGFSVIPLKPHDKVPLFPWKEFQDRRATKEEITSWFGSGENNIGIVTGSVSGLAVVDCDNQAAVELAQKKGIGEGPKVQTGKGWHFYCRYVDGLRNFQKRDDLPGIDLRADGGYVCAPPSIHPSGKIYQWIDWSKILPAFPSWVVADPTMPASSQKTTIHDCYVGVKAGSRNTTLARLAGHWVKDLSLVEALQMAVTWNARLEKPLSETELRITIESIFSAEVKSKKDEEVSQQSLLEQIVTVRSIADKVQNLYEVGLPKGESLGWAGAEGFYHPRRGEWTLVTGIPGHGKSEFMDNVAIRLAMKGWRFAFFSAEKLPIESHVASLVEKYSGFPFEDTRYSDRITQKNLEAAIAFLSEHFIFIEPKDDKSTLQTLLAICKAAMEKERLDGIVIDPWNEVEHNIPINVTETNYISHSLTLVRRFARQNNVHIWLVAHPTKMKKDEHGNYGVPTPYDVSGSSAWRNKADMAITIWRNLLDDSRPVEVHVQKVRFKKVGRIGKVELKYVWETGRYEDV